VSQENLEIVQAPGTIAKERVRRRGRWSQTRCRANWASSRSSLLTYVLDSIAGGRFAESSLSLITTQKFEMNIEVSTIAYRLPLGGGPGMAPGAGK
jgi:hypothetical protein